MVISIAQVDFTGGCSETFRIKDFEGNIFDDMLKAYNRGSFLACSLDKNPEVVEQIQPNGLVRGHAYAITKVRGTYSWSTPALNNKNSFTAMYVELVHGNVR